MHFLTLQMNFLTLRQHFLTLRQHLLFLRQHLLSLRQHLLSLELPFLPLRMHLISLRQHLLSLRQHRWKSNKPTYRQLPCTHKYYKKNSVTERSRGVSFRTDISSFMLQNKIKKIILTIFKLTT